MTTREQNDFLTQTGPRAPPIAADRWSTDLASVAQLDVSADGLTIVARGVDGIARLDPEGTTVAATSDLQSGGVAYLPGSGENGDPYVLATVPGDANVVVLNADTLEPADEEALVPELAGPVGPIMIQGSGDDRQVWVLTGPLPVVAGVHPATGGGVATYYQEGGYEYPIRVQLREDQRKTPDQLRRIVLRSGSTQLSYWAARIRYTMMMASPNKYTAVDPARISSSD